MNRNHRGADDDDGAPTDGEDSCVNSKEKY